jgi:hypothetical protein
LSLHRGAFAAPEGLQCLGHSYSLEAVCRHGRYSWTYCHALGYRPSWCKCCIASCSKLICLLQTADLQPRHWICPKQGDRGNCMASWRLGGGAVGQRLDRSSNQTAVERHATGDRGTTGGRWPRPWRLALARASRLRGHPLIAPCCALAFVFRQAPTSAPSRPGGGLGLGCW